MIQHYAFKKGFLLVTFLLLGLCTSAQVIVPFSSIYQVNQRGGIVFLSNAALACSSDPSTATGTCQAAAQETPLLGTTRNDNFLSSYVDIDGDATTFMSSSDRLDLPACSRITKAYLFWGASGTATTGYTQIKMKLNAGAYQTVTATVAQTNTTGILSYHCYADVTNIMASAGISDRVTVADIPSSLVGQLNTFGSWNLVVVYANDNMNMRQLNVMNGLSYHSIASPTINVPVSGFLTPTTGAVGFEIGVYTHDGDRGVTGDDILFNGNLTFLPLTDITTNPAADVMNSTASNNGIANPFRIPLLSNTMGSDADIYVPLNLLNVYLANAATSATVQMLASNDNYLTQAITTAIDTYDPDLRVTLRATDVNGGTLNPGDLVQYRIKGYNIGSDNSVNTYITDTLDPHLNYIPNSTSIVFGPNTGSKTDALSDDQVDYNPATRILKIRIGSAASNTLGGTVMGSNTGVDSTVVTFSVNVSQSCLKLACINNTIVSRAWISGAGATFPAHSFTVTSTPGTSNTLSCTITGPTTATINTSACASATASSSSPVCAGRPLFLFATNDPESNFSWTGPASFTSSLNNPTIATATTLQAGVYNVTLTVPGNTCFATASTTAAVTICTPVAVNDFTATSINVQVSGNAAANDVNAIPGGTFSILSQPASGTVAINATTGVYSYTPATGFTGVTTATYQLCNSLPVICVTASITFTVYPNLVANPDVINTVPSASVTGNLMANDNGTVAGAAYQLTFTQVSPGTGTLTVNPSNGQYTFVPSPTFTGMAQSTYTLCNTSVSPSQCSSTTFSVYALPNPGPVNDNTTTVINTPVIANAGANDAGTAGGSFTITGQPANGTITINSTTGQFTFTPASNFTGVTSATYNLCNGAPASCSPAVITITVYPMLAANPDAIITTPGTTAFGNVLANDSGTTSGAAYAISFTQVSPLVGTLTINPSTGQYTFIPAPLYSGNSQTTYTVCNTSVNPQQCSTTTISITVSNLPFAVNDATATLINTPVAGNAGANDSGTLLGTFTFGSASTGTLSGNPLTGQYLYTPPANFTGTAIATYTLCNLNSPPCSTATILFTVYPLIQANPDAIVTTPSTSANGNLLTNDNGVTAGAVYSVSATALPSSTGTLTVDPATGSYTFTPDPGFTGLAQSSYTVCNTSVNPQQCSSASISIGVGIPPLAVNDETVTLINTAVTGNVSLNDSNAGSGSFTFGSATSGTLSGNATTGQYTFTPDAGFTGTVSATYTLCTPYSPPCSDAVITITVYASITANPEFISTTLDHTVTGNVLSNDTGITAGASYSVSFGSLSPAVGTLSVSPSSGQYTFTPATGFTGSATVNYTLAQVYGAQQVQSSSTTDTIVVTNGGSPIGVAKSVSGVSYNTNGTFNLSYKIVVKNYSNQPMSQVEVRDDLSSTFPAPSTYTVITAPALLNSSGSQLTLNSAFSATDHVLTTAASSSLAPGRADSIVFTVKVDPHHAQQTYTNFAVASAMHTGSMVADSSANGLNPDTDGDGDPGNNTSPTTFSVNIVNIGIAKYAERSSSSGNGCYNVLFKFTVKNYGVSPIYNIQVFDDLDNTFGVLNYTVSSSPTTVNGYLVPDNSFNGSSHKNLVGYTSQLGVGQTDTVKVNVSYCASSARTFSNTAIAYGNSAPGGGFIGYDISTAGLDPDPNHNGNPSDSTESDATIFVPSEDFQIPQGFSPNSDGINDRFEIKGLSEFKNVEVTILNRWGAMVYNKKNYDNSWDGTSNAGLEFGGHALPEGTYYYIIDLGNDQKPVKGYVYINRR